MPSSPPPAGPIEPLLLMPPEKFEIVTAPVPKASPPTRIGLPAEMVPELAMPPPKVAMFSVTPLGAAPLLAAAGIDLTGARDFSLSFSFFVCWPRRGKKRKEKEERTHWENSKKIIEK